MTRADDRRRYDKQRRADKPSRGWYKSKGWAVRRRQCLAEQPYCVYCLPRPVLATVANHNPPHREDWGAFFRGPIESVCKPHHDGLIQAAEQQGFMPDIGADGWPLDPKHPSRRDSAR